MTSCPPHLLLSEEDSSLQVDLLHQISSVTVLHHYVQAASLYTHSKHCYILLTQTHDDVFCMESP